MNYTGDRLNFGQAAERAKAENLKVEVVVVADDCALDYETAAHRHVGRRGIAGTVLVHKVGPAQSSQVLAKAKQVPVFLPPLPWAPVSAPHLATSPTRSL